MQPCPCPNKQASSCGYREWRGRNWWCLRNKPESACPVLAPANQNPQDKPDDAKSLGELKDASSE